MKKRLLSVLLTLGMLLSMIPFTVSAATSITPSTVLFEYNWFTESWDVVPYDSEEKEAFNAATEDLEPHGTRDGAKYTITEAPTLNGESILNEETGRYEVSDETYTWYWYGCRILQLSENGITPYNEAINRTFDGSSAGSSTATLQYMWVREGRDGTGDRPDTKTVTYQFSAEDGSLPDGTQFFGSTRSSEYSEYDIQKDPDIIETADRSTEIGSSIEMEQIPGYLFDTGGYSGLLHDRFGYYHCYAVYEDEETGIKRVWTADDSWKYDGEECSSLVMPDKDIILTPIWNKLAEIDLNAAKKTDVWLYYMPDAEYDLFEEVMSKISFPDYPEAEPGTIGGVILKGLEKQSEFDIPSPVSSDMTEEEIASDIQPYVTATDAEGNVLAKWVCTGAEYRDDSNKYQTVPSPWTPCTRSTR